MNVRRISIKRLGLAGLLIVAVCILSGCSTPALDSARYSFYSGRLQKADETLEKARVPEKDRVLLLMERGMVRQATGAYEASAEDFIKAADILTELETYSVSKGAASWVVNDGVQNFRGTPYERTMIHAFCAKNHLARGFWDDAAVEARRIIRSVTPEVKKDYPDDAYSLYMAGFCLQMIDDHSNAALQFRKASELLTDIAIDDKTGRFIPRPPPSTNFAEHASQLLSYPHVSEDWTSELVCFVTIGRSVSEAQQWSSASPISPALYADIYHKGAHLGRSHNLTDTVQLAYTTDQIESARKVAKTVGRVVFKEALASAIEHNTQNELMGDLVRLILISMLEQPDIRRWETLPRWLQVARVPCPPDLDEFEVVFRSASGMKLRSIIVKEPITRRRNTFVSFCRDLPPQPQSAPVKSE